MLLHFRHIMLVSKHSLIRNLKMLSREQSILMLSREQWILMLSREQSILQASRLV